MRKERVGASGRFGGGLGGAARAKAFAKRAVPFTVVPSAPSDRRSACSTGSVGSTVSTRPAEAAAAAITPAASYAFIQQALVGAQRADTLARENEALKAKIAALEAADAARSALARAAVSSAPAGHMRRQDAAAAVQAARAESAVPRVAGRKMQARSMLASVSRGELLVVKPKASYRSGYTFADICELCARITDEHDPLTLAEIRKHPEDYKVPRNTLVDYLKPYGPTRAAKWLVRRDVQRKTTLPKSGGGTVLGDAVEEKLMVTMADAALMNCPYRYEEVTELVRGTAIDLGCVVKKTGSPYTQLTDVSTLVTAFLRRCAEANVFFIQKNGRKLGLQRHINQHYISLKAYAAKVNPALLAFQQLHGKLGLGDVGNWDETGLDLCAFASMAFLCPHRFGNQVVVPFEQLPHWTLVVGFVGSVPMQMLAIMKAGAAGAEGQTPSPHHAQLLSVESGVFLGQSPTGCITNPLKSAFFKLQVDAGIIGDRPLVINVDEHDSNLNNDELIELARKYKILLVIPPPHTSAARGGMGAQQCARSKHHGGLIAGFKAVARGKLQEQFFVAVRDKQVQTKISTCEVLKICEVAWKESFKPHLIEKLNAELGYYIDADGNLQWDLTRLRKTLPGVADVAATTSVAAPASALAAGPGG